MVTGAEFLLVTGVVTLSLTVSVTGGYNASLKHRTVSHSVWMQALMASKVEWAIAVLVVILVGLRASHKYSVVFYQAQ